MGTPRQRNLVGSPEGKRGQLSFGSVATMARLRRNGSIAANDHIWRPEALEELCFFHQSMYFMKQYKQKGHNDPDEGEVVDTGMRFNGEHPGRGFAYLAKVRCMRIPVASMATTHLTMRIMKITPTATLTAS